MAGTMAADLNDETPQFLDVEYLGQYGGWHFYVAERPEDRALFTSASLPDGIYYGIAIRRSTANAVSPSP
jgi:hypothetical protein